MAASDEDRDNNVYLELYEVLRSSDPVRRSLANQFYSARLINEGTMDSVHKMEDTVGARLLLEEIHKRKADGQHFESVLRAVETQEELKLMSERLSLAQPIGIEYVLDDVSLCTSAASSEASKEQKQIVKQQAREDPEIIDAINKINEKIKKIPRLACLAQSLQSHFRKLLVSVATTLEEVNVKRLQMIIKGILDYDISDSRTYKVRIDTFTKVDDILDYLHDNHFIGYLNYGLLEELIIDFVSNEEHPIHKKFESYKRQYMELVNSTSFIDLLQIFKDYPDLSPLAVVGLPKIVLRLDKPWPDKAISTWTEYMKMRFSFIDNTYLHEVTVQCILVTLVVRHPSLKIWEELNDPDILSQLSKDGITIIDCSDIEKFMQRELYGAVAIGDIPHLMQLVKAGVNINATFQPHVHILRNSQSLVHLAVDTGQESMLSALISCNIDVNLFNKDGKTALYYAIKTDRSNMVQMLLEHGAKIDKDGGSHLHYFVEADQVEPIKTLLSSGTDGNITNKYGDTPLHLAIKRGNTSIVEALLSHGVDPTIKNKQGWTPLYTAAMENAVDTFKHLLESGCSLETEDKFGWNYLHFAAANGHSVAVSFLIKEASIPVDSTDIKEKKTPLHLAAEKGHEEIVQSLLSNQAFVNSQDKHGKAPLHYAAENGHVNIVISLLEHNADINITDKECCTPLHYASSYHLPVVKTLLENGANTRSEGKDGWKPLHCATWNGKNEIVKALLEDETVIDDKDKGGWRAVNYAVMKGHHEVLRTLIENGADITVKDEGEWSLLHIAARRNQAAVAEVLLENKFDVNIKDKSGWRAFSVALVNAHPNVVETMLRFGASVNLRDSDEGKKAIHIAVDSSEKPKRFDIVKLLLEHPGVDPNDTDDNGCTPLHYAANHSYSNIAQLLLEKGADPHRIDKEGKTPLDNAEDDEQVMKVFREFGSI